MSEELQELDLPVEDTTDPQAPAEETNADSQGSEASQTQNQEEEVDYKAELERVRKTLNQAEHKIVELKKKKPEVEGDLEERVASRVAAMLEEKQSSWQSLQQKEFIDEAIRERAASPEEAELIKFHFENRVKANTGSKAAILEAIEDAKLLANKKKILKTNQELAEALKARSTVSSAPSFSGAKITAPEKPNLSPRDEKLIQWAERITGKKANLT